LLSASNELQAVHPRHLQVGYEEIEWLSAEELDRLRPIVRDHHLPTPVEQNFGEVLRKFRIVIDYQTASHACLRASADCSRETTVSFKSQTYQLAKGPMKSCILLKALAYRRAG